MNAPTHYLRAAHRRPQIAIAALAALAVLGSLAFLVADHQPPARARVTRHVHTVDIGALAAQIQASISTQREQASEHSAQVDWHELRAPDDQRPASEAQAIVSAESVVRRWLAGYLPYEVDRLSTANRRDITATSTGWFASSLLAHEPLIPPAQQQLRPPEGRFLGLLTTLAADQTQAAAYVEVSYGLERDGFHLTLIRGEHGWLVAGFRG